MSRLPTSDLNEATAHAAVYLRRLRREQLRLALLSLVAFGGAIFALPLILAYQAWTYWVFRKRITRAVITQAAH